MPDLQFKINLCCKVRNVGILRVCFAHYLESLHIFVLELNFSDDKHVQLQALGLSPAGSRGKALLVLQMSENSLGKLLFLQFQKNTANLLNPFFLESWMILIMECFSFCPTSSYVFILDVGLWSIMMCTSTDTKKSISFILLQTRL